MMHPIYYIDTNNNGEADYFLNFGPWWYEPDSSNATRPNNGDQITIEGGLWDGNMMGYPMIVVYEINGVFWRDPLDAFWNNMGQHSHGGGHAIQLANEARRQAENALAQANAQKARLASEAAATASKSKTTGGAGDYTVVRGDNLWHISGKSDVYGNPYQWPLLYKANRSKIKDADLIYPGQKLSINRNASDADIKAAVRHAKTRGSWSLGVVEESDRAYLGR